MDFKKCNRCGSFYVSEGDVCPNCSTKDNFEFSTFKSYVKENGFTEDLDTISSAINVSVKHLNRYIGYEDFSKLESADSKKTGMINLD